MINVVLVGSLRRERGILLEAHSTVTALIGERLTLIDTSSKDNRQKLLESLKLKNIDPNDVDSLILTHTHEDHISNMDLFPNAEIFAHELEKPSFPFTPVKEGDEVFPGILVMHTPGHTSGSISILVEEERCIIAGDAIPTEDNVFKNVPPGLCINRELAVSSMQRILNNAESIIPGHGKRLYL